MLASRLASRLFTEPLKAAVDANNRQAAQAERTASRTASAGKRIFSGAPLIT